LSRKKILFVGPKIQSQEQLGGAVVSFDILVEYCIRHKIDHEIIYLNNYPLSRIKSYLATILSFFQKIGSVDVVMLNFSPAGYRYLGPILYIIARVWSKQVALRMFGGDLDQVHKTSNPMLRLILANTVLKSKVVFLQTHNLISHFKDKGIKNIKWLPTSRPLSGHRRLSIPFSRKFVFVGHIKEEKGVLLLKDAFEALGDKYSIHFYGPIVDKSIALSLGANYKGILEPSQVSKTLSEYDVFCFPTFWKGEGYPGVIIESFMAGIPVLASDWLSIPELVIHGESGILVQPKNLNNLKEQILKIDNSAYQVLREGAVARANIFDSEKVNSMIIKELEFLCVES
jgi:glycosyltransferase involved in cell wall biosynthesis